MMINQLEEIMLAYSHILIHRNEKESYPLNYLTSWPILYVPCTAMYLPCKKYVLRVPTLYRVALP